MNLHRLAILLGAVAVASCSSNPTGTNGTGGRSLTITVNSNFFSPTPDTVSAGQVTFSWASGTHNVTWDSGPTTLANSGNKSSGTFVVPVQAGTYNYHCSLHAGMNGRIVVQ
jgi:plastocyanin